MTDAPVPPPQDLASPDAISRREFGRRLGAAALVAGTSINNTDRWTMAGDGELTHAPSSDLCFTSATELAAMIRSKKVSAREVMQAHLAQIERVNPAVNSIVTLVADRAMKDAAAADEELAHGKPRGPLHGLPIAHKDLVETKGIRTTFGSPFFRDHIPNADAPIITLIRQGGALTIGKTNTPEFGAGSHTFNTVFGAVDSMKGLVAEVLAPAAAPAPAADGSAAAPAAPAPRARGAVRVDEERLDRLLDTIGELVIADKGYAGHEFEHHAATLEALIARPARGSVCDAGRWRRVP
jgi:chemotaxis protein histidine kinase CheA